MRKPRKTLSEPSSIRTGTSTFTSRNGVFNINCCSAFRPSRSAARSKLRSVISRTLKAAGLLMEVAPRDGRTVEARPLWEGAQRKSSRADKLSRATRGPGQQGTLWRPAGGRVKSGGSAAGHSIQRKRSHGAFVQLRWLPPPRSHGTEKGD